MKLLFGTPRIELCASVRGVPNGEWMQIDTPKEDTTTLETTEGDDLEANEEGGDLIEILSDASSYTLSFELFKKKGEAMPLSDKEYRGVVSGEYAIRVTSEIDSDAPGFQIDRCSVKTARLYSPAETYRKVFTFSALKPANGETVKEVENNLLGFSYIASSKTVRVLNYGDLTIDVTEEWISVSENGRFITFSVTENTAKEPRKGHVIVTDAESNVTTIVTIEQAKSPNFIKLLTGEFLLTASGNRIKLNL